MRSFRAFFIPAIFLAEALYAQIQPSVTFDPATGNYLIRYQGLEGDTVEVFFEPATKILPTVYARVFSESNPDTLKYEYIVGNEAGSQQRLLSFSIEHFSPAFYKTAPNLEWRIGRNFLPGTVKWAHTRKDPAGLLTPFNGIAPDSSASGFSFESTGLPAIVISYFKGATGVLAFPDEPPSEIDDLLKPLEIFPNNTVKLKSIGPKEPQEPFVVVVFLDTLISYTDQSLAFGWIANSLTADKYTNLFSTARSQLVSNDSTGARLTLTTVLPNVAVDSAAALLTSEAIALLRYNTEYLVDRLPAPAGFLIPDLPAALTISSVVASAAFAGDNFSITGFNHKMDGTPANDGDDRHGIVTTTAAARQGILNGLQAFQRDNVNGSGGAQADVVQQTLSFNVAAFIDTVLAHVDQTVPVNVAGTFGSASNPVIVHATQGVQSSGNVTGTGILLVDGPLFVSGNFNWTGLVIHRNSPFSGPATSVSTSLKITGGMLVYNTGPWGASLQVSNQLIIRASQETLEMLRTNL